MKVKQFTPGTKFKEKVRPDRISENDVENYLIKQVKLAGGESHKWHARGRAGVHDRIVLFPSNEVWLVEVKAPDGTKSPKQKEFHDHLAYEMEYTRSITVWCYQDVDEWLDIRNAITQHHLGTPLSNLRIENFSKLIFSRIKR